MSSLEGAFWQQDCRGPALPHTHGEHIGELRDFHAKCPCKDCGITPERWHAMWDPASREAGIVDPDSLPLALEQPECGYRHGAIATRLPKLGDEGWEWPKCSGCGVQIEPKIATGDAGGPLFGIGRGWVSPRTKRKWEAIAFRFQGQFG